MNFNHWLLIMLNTFIVNMFLLLRKTWRASCYTSHSIQQIAIDTRQNLARDLRYDALTIESPGRPKRTGGVSYLSTLN